MRLQLVTLALVASATLALFGCRGKLLATARLTGPGSAEVHFRGGGKNYRLWSDYDGSWTGGQHSRLPIRYEIDVVQNNKSIGKIACDTESGGGGSAVCGSETTFNNQHTANCEVSLACTLPKLGPSEVTLKVTAKTDPTRVSHVSNMSLNVREQ